MRSADDAGLIVGKKQRSTVGSGHADRQTRDARHDSIGARTAAVCPWLVRYDHVRRMNLIGREQSIRTNTERSRHASTVLGNLVGRIARADAAVERGIDTL
jgi:hypothetical protein